MRELWKMKPSLPTVKGCLFLSKLLLRGCGTSPKTRGRHFLYSGMMASATYFIAHKTHLHSTHSRTKQNHFNPLITSLASPGSRTDRILNGNIPDTHHRRHLTNWPSPAMKYKPTEVTVIDLCRKTASVMRAQTLPVHSPAASSAGVAMWGFVEYVCDCFWTCLIFFGEWIHPNGNIYSSAHVSNIAVGCWDGLKAFFSLNKKIKWNKNSIVCAFV